MSWPMEDKDERSAEQDAAIIRLPLAEQIAGRLRTEIVSGRWAPGERLPEHLLCSRLNVSRTPLRQAFKVLESEGLIALLPHRGAVVTEPTPEDTHDKLIVLGTLECLAVELACERATDAEMAELKALHDEMMRCYTVHDVDGYYRLNDRVHRAVVRISKSGTITELHDLLTRHVDRVRNIVNIGEDLKDRSKHEHEMLIEAILVRDKSAARARMAEHMTSIREKIQAALAAGR
jgi:DNA-binding GntR family transcriptional regulator